MNQQNSSNWQHQVILNTGKKYELKTMAEKILKSMFCTTGPLPKLGSPDTRGWAYSYHKLHPRLSSRGLPSRESDQPAKKKSHTLSSGRIAKKRLGPHPIPFREAIRTIQSPTTQSFQSAFFKMITWLSSFHLFH